MTCSEISTLIPLHLTGELDSPRARKLTAHLDGCAECAERVRAHKFVDVEVREAILSEPVETGPLARRVLQLIALESRQPRRGGWRFAWGAAAVSAALALLAVAGYRATVHTPVTGLYAAAAMDHRIEIVGRQIRKWRVDLPSIEELAQRQGIAISAITAFAPPGYRLQEGRLCRLDGRIFLHLVYTDGEKNFSFYLRQGDDSPATGVAHGSVDGKPIYTAELGAEHVAGFQDGSLKGMVVTDQSGDAALRFARMAVVSI